MTHLKYSPVHSFVSHISHRPRQLPQIAHGPVTFLCHPKMAPKHNAAEFWVTNTALHHCFARVPFHSFIPCMRVWWFPAFLPSSPGMHAKRSIKCVLCRVPLASSFVNLSNRLAPPFDTSTGAGARKVGRCCFKWGLRKLKGTSFGVHSGNWDGRVCFCPLLGYLVWLERAVLSPHAPS